MAEHHVLDRVSEPGKSYTFRSYFEIPAAKATNEM